MKKIILTLMLFVLIIIGTLIIIPSSNNSNINSENKLYITATLFPQYDFIRQIGKDKVVVSLILPFGTESHSYDPTPNDILLINNSDMLVYTGDDMEPWAARIISSLNQNVHILDASKNIDLVNFEHNHEHTNEHFEENHSHEADPHIWMDVENAILIVQNILNELIIIDPVNAEFYTNNAVNYINELIKLDKEFKNIEKSKKIVFGSPFSYSYLVNKYHLEYISVYDSCSETIEPSLTKVKSVIDELNEEDINYILCEPLSSNMIAKTISYETSATILPFYSIHNISKKDFELGETYISLMRKNLESIKTALN